MTSVSSSHCTGMWHYLYQWRWFKNKGVALTLFWSFSAFVVFNFISHNLTVGSTGSSDYKPRVIFALLGTTLMFPLAGWLADVYVGRYRMISACLKIMLLGTIVFGIKSAFEKSSLSGQLPKHIGLVDIFATLIVCIGLAGFQANIIQFSLDQLFDSSSFEIMSFIVFYVWSYVAADLVVVLAFVCACDSYLPIAKLVFPLFLSLAGSSDFLFSHWLVKEPVSRNPLKLILQVLRYAAKNKYPRQRSAFTYWDDKHYSRIDLAKSKYGGPFTTEEVEDVKTFFRMLVIIVVVCLFLGVPINGGRIANIAGPLNFRGIHRNNCTRDMIYPPDCFKLLVLESSSMVPFVGLPFWEFLLFPILWRCAMKLKFLQKFSLGMIFFLLYLTSRVSLDVIGQVGQQHLNQTIHCPMSYNNSNNKYGLTYWWLALPNTFYGLGGCVIAVAGLQFISAQCPYSMKGLMLGVAYLATGLSACLFFPLSLPFKLVGFHGWGGLNCMFWYLMACIAAALVIGVVFLIVSSRYKSRQRDENVPSQQFLADVYSDHHMRSSKRGISHQYHCID